MSGHSQDWHLRKINGNYFEFHLFKIHSYSKSVMNIFVLEIFLQVMIDPTLGDFSFIELSHMHTQGPSAR